MAPTTMDVDSSTLPAPNPVVPAPASLDSARDLVAERNAEAAANKAEAAKKQTRFQARKITAPERPPATSAPEYENYMFEAAANNPFASLKLPTPSTFVPNTQVCFYLLNYMDHLMAGTKRWTDNCVGWNPLISQLYISVLIYYQIFRAMDAASMIGPGSPLSSFLLTFGSIFPLNDIWIPGPLVSFFRNLSAFWPTDSDRFGNVCPFVPAEPNWTQNSRYNLGTYNNSAHLNTLLPNISAIISRLRTICLVAAQSADQTTFNNSRDGPYFIEHMFGNALDNAINEQRYFSGPAIKWMLPDNLQMWKLSSSRLAYLQIPTDLDFNNDAVSNDWISFLRFDNNQHMYFANISALMSKYCQFFQGSRPLSEIMPNCSAAGAIKLRSVAGSDLIDRPAFHAAVPAVPGPPAVPAVPAHRTLRAAGRLVQNGRIAVEDVPTAHVYAAITFGFNSYWDLASQTAMRQGPFWTLGPDTNGREQIEVLPGTLSTIVRKYHSDVRIAADKQ